MVAMFGSASKTNVRKTNMKKEQKQRKFYPRNENNRVIISALPLETSSRPSGTVKFISY